MTPTNFLLLLAVAPGLLLCIYAYRLDKIEKEPIGLLIKLIGLGVVSTLPTMALEILGEGIISCFWEEGSFWYIFVDTFFVVGCAEEGMKFLALKLGSWKSPEFDYRFDGILYGICTSAGFAIFENIMYVMDGGIETAILRAITSIPGHLIFGLYMGYFYGEAKSRQLDENFAGMKMSLKKAFWVPVLLHGFYDFCAFQENILFTLIFLVFIFGMEIISLKKIRKYSKEDTPL